jgi:hypothetical protein
VHVQDTEAENHNHGDFCLHRHLHSPKHRDRQKGLASASVDESSPIPEHIIDTHIEPVRQHSQRGHSIRRGNNLFGRDAVPSCEAVVPLLVDGVTLKDVPEEDAKTPDGNDNDADAKNPDVDLLGSESEKKDADAEFDDHHQEDVSCDSQRLPL